MSARDQAVHLNAEAIALEEAGRRDDAIAGYERAAAADPAWATPLYNLGLLYKRAKDWQKSLEYNARAVSVTPDHEAACWNLGHRSHRARSLGCGATSLARVRNHGA
jgi:tetratricopeptide (TPR) repeat protein